MRTAYFFRLFLIFLASGLIARGEDIAAVHADPADSNPASATVEVRDFKVRVDNRAIGTHRLTIRTNGETHQVKFQTDANVNLIVSTYADLWFDDQRRLVRQKSVESGHQLELRIKQIQLHPDDH